MEDFRPAPSARVICPHNEFCGGCIYQGVSYENQLKEKEREVVRLLEEKAVTPKVMDKIQGCSTIYGYRNKMEYTFGDLVKDGEMTLGMHKKRNFMSIITVDQCQLVDPDFNVILSATLEFANQQGYTFYHKRSHKGLLRNLIVRKGIRTGEILVNMVTSSEAGFDEEGFVSMLQGLSLQNTLVGVLRTFNDSLADAVICDELKVLYGRDYYMEEILGLKFKVSAFSFFQTNVEAAERLYTQALSLIDDFQGKTVFDLYCGTGTISQILALKAKKVIGIEIVEEAVLAAQANAKFNGLENCSFLAGDVFEVLNHMEEKPEVIVVDPPRVGMSLKAVEKIAAYGVDQIVYISCNPKTLAINLQQFAYLGYQVDDLKPFDNFPMTKHTECVALLSRVTK
ncbi:MAG: 23S rRNA (uracil(1939)-C(5))-methyltransferase RlmD [Firmicutes bacterium]|nr:23S rRNA (uracil(1939)-C(5))-methyltransferase RlmD [Bacillota bacterium]